MSSFLVYFNTLESFLSSGRLYPSWASVLAFSDTFILCLTETIVKFGVCIYDEKSNANIAFVSLLKHNIAVLYLVDLWQHFYCA